MKHVDTLVLFFAFLSLVGCQSAPPIKQWSMQDIMKHYSSQSHHWGQNDQKISNNGWSEYGFLQLKMGGPEYIQLSQSNGELLVKLVTIETGKMKFSALSIPRAGIFYIPKDIGTCKPDPIEELGIYAEIALNFLANAYPSGPKQTIPIGITKASGPAAEIRFMHAVARVDRPWTAEVEVKESSPGNHIIEINQDGTKIIAQWTSEPREITSSDSPVNAWASCWSGVWSHSPDGKSSFSGSIKNTGSISTFGEVRAQLRQ